MIGTIHILTKGKCIINTEVKENTERANDPSQGKSLWLQAMLKLKIENISEFSI